MACQTCGHTMQGIGTSVPPVAWWCPRCGTIREAGAYHAPKLVERCRELVKRIPAEQWMLAEQVRLLGVAEAIDTPASRKGES